MPPRFAMVSAYATDRLHAPRFAMVSVYATDGFRAPLVTMVSAYATVWSDRQRNTFSLFPWADRIVANFLKTGNLTILTILTILDDF